MHRINTPHHSCKLSCAQWWERMAGKLGLQMVTGILMQNIPNTSHPRNHPNLPLTPVHNSAVRGTSGTPNVFSYDSCAITCRYQPPQHTHIYFLFYNVHSLCLELVGRDVINSLRETMFLHVAAEIGSGTVTR